jgi:glycine/D-amino acid oxidase-like deaminating enzyme
MDELTLRDPLKGESPGQGLPHPNSYWAAISGTAPEDDGLLLGDREVDVAIIGGGYTGLSTAYFLGKHYGIKATVLEANRPGWGCSGRNGGFARPVIGRLGPGAMIKVWGLETARRMFAEGHAALDTVRELIAAGVDCDPSATGHLKIAHRPACAAALEADAEVLRKQFNYPSQLLSADDLRARHLGGPQSHGGLILKDAIGLNPLRLSFGVLRLARAQGAVVMSGSPVSGWSKDGTHHVLKTPEGRVRARQVLIATNGYTPEGLHPSVRGTLLPVLSHIIVTRPMTPAEKAEAAFHTSHVITDTRNLLYYFRRMPDERVLFGGRGQITDSPGSRAAQREFLLAELKRKCPALSSITVEYDWCGWVCITRDQMPHVHHAGDDATVSYALGYQGSGVAAGLHAGRLAADRLAGKPLPPLAPAFSPLPRFPFAALRRVGQRAAFAWYRVKDERA